MNIQQNHEFNPHHKHIVLIAAFTATGNMARLKNALNGGLDTGLTINQIREELVQLYAYCGFPRSLNGITMFMSVLEKRKSEGIKDPEGQLPVAVTGTNETKYEMGRKMLETLTGRPVSGQLTGANAFAPGIDAFLKEHLFADIFGRGVLTYQERELAMIAVLASLPGLEAQLQAHLGMGMTVGLTEGQLEQVFGLLENNIGKQQADAGRTVLTKLKATK
ncbi:carboxymuconolactone decarboxylase family protein [Chitinophaga ginsengisegetis]|uniref:carboxymuconolactone decarboxylase family protein n=1 Tax=Chitinophaga ginsengisegetis TaxID=393003 RepID=UPI000DBA66FE|nr:carboxymuconolactone decarboxylase family protein [Chitinophaga ginsengisegetis]MDR6568090.1 alkylhydroperoxidase/carboxymuconolactone decarboxylase family protein YurZ [Chitinophaga ginsengisegetis]MDR6647355.1 alkylhydroperoxidase/carboxymuconolactone decarboxylase family protein YurZ [Chitinophaga ginsengisegetis]MDR6653705.1 alkylhydroperoxidase/carboxymuconolactone decarboxylase family protein YurZ [Chitinophaga ginsengisegetis]